MCQGHLGMEVSVNELARCIEAFVASQGDSAAVPRVEGLERITGGMSREAFRFDLVTGGGQAQRHPCILMRSAPAGLLDTDRGWEFRILRALQGSGIPVPEVLWLDEDGTWLERPAFIMTRASGTADRRPLGRERRGLAER